MKIKIPCNLCEGTGTTDPIKIEACPKCLGKREVEIDAEVTKFPVVDNGKIIRYKYYVEWSD